MVAEAGYYAQDGTEVDLSDMSEEDLRNLAALARPETE